MAVGDVLQTFTPAGDSDPSFTLTGLSADNTLVLSIYGREWSPIASITDNLGGTWQEAGTYLGIAGHDQSATIYYRNDTASGDLTVTVDAGTYVQRMFVYEIEGALTAAVDTSTYGHLASDGLTSFSMPGLSYAAGDVGFISVDGGFNRTFSASGWTTQGLGQLSRKFASASSTDVAVSHGSTAIDLAALMIRMTPNATTPVVRKSSTFDIETTLGTITTATLNGVNVFDHVTGQVGTTVSFAGAATDEITTSGEYSLVLGDGTGTETITLQVNVVGVTPSNNPVQKDGAALASLTGVQLRITNGTALNGAQRYYTATATTDASGNLSNIDLSDTAAAIDDPVRLQILTAAGDSINAIETVGLI